MNGKRIAYAVIALLAVLAIALSAATLTDPQDTGGGAGPVLEGEEPGVLDESDTIGGLGWTLYVLAAIVVLIAIGALIGVLHYPLDIVREFGQTVVAGVFLVIVFLVLISLMGSGAAELPDFLGGQTPDGGGIGGGDDETLGSETADSVAPTSSDWTVVALLLVGLLAIGAIGLLASRQLTGDGPRTSPEEDALAAIGASAGEVADRLESTATVDNEVYRAWKEMTGHLDLRRPAVRTPAEFRDAAVEAGMEPVDVDELTGLFEEVRYGGAPPTAEREAHALKTLRRIERRYGEPGDAWSASGQDHSTTGEKP